MGVELFAVRAELVKAVIASRIGSLPTSRGLPGGNSLFFVSPKKSKQKKGDPMVWDPFAAAQGQPAVLAENGVELELAALRQSLALIRFRLRSSAQPDGWWGRERERAPAGSRFARPRLPESDFSPQSPFGRAEQRRWRRCQGRQLFEPKASSADPRRNRAAQVARSEAEGPGQSGRLVFGDFLLATQKKVTCRRATPGLPANHHGFEAPTSLMEINKC